MIPNSMSHRIFCELKKEIFETNSPRSLDYARVFLVFFRIGVFLVLVVVVIDILSFLVPCVVVRAFACDHVRVGARECEMENGCMRKTNPILSSGDKMKDETEESPIQYI